MRWRGHGGLLHGAGRLFAAGRHSARLCAQSWIVVDDEDDDEERNEPSSDLARKREEYDDGYK